MSRYVTLGACAALVGGAWLFWTSSNSQSEAERAYEAAAPAAAPAEYSREGARGRLAFNQNCATCHGRDAAGGETAPALIHKIYEPSHHGDDSIRLAAARGVRAHHWDFGDMPPQPDVSAKSVEDIIVFIREEQARHGIR